MTYLESLSRIKRNVNPKFWNTEDIEHYNNIIKALEKQIPKKLINYAIDNMGGYIVYECECPNCQHSRREAYLFDCCEKCGQAIDWSDTE